MRYVIHPGYVVSKNDGDVHYISYDTLIKLYKVNPDQCTSRYRRDFFDKQGDIHLWPDYTGKYKIPELKIPEF
jgi:hypothetical protein